MREQSKEVVFFVGSDITSHLIAYELAHIMQDKGVSVLLCFVRHSAKKAQPEAIEELALHERRILNECVYPYLKNANTLETSKGHVRWSSQAVNLCPRISEKFIDNVNDSCFIDELKGMSIDLGLSIRCYQKFSQEFIDVFSKENYLWNLHPGILPKYRGVMTLVRAMQNNDREFGYSLHKINADWDAGDIINIKSKPIDYSHSMLHELVCSYQLGVATALPYIEKALAGEVVDSEAQVDASYYTFPTEKELEYYKERRIRLTDKEEMMSLYRDFYGRPGTGLNIQQVIDDYLEKLTKEATV